MALGDIIIAASNQAAQDAHTHGQAAQTDADQAAAATDTPQNNCREGMDKLDQAWQEQAQSQEAAGKAEALDALTHDPAFAALPAVILGPSLATIQTTTHDNAVAAAADATNARTHILAQEGAVLAAYAACENNALLACINNSLLALHNAAEVVHDPGGMVGPANIQDMVINTLIPRAGGTMLGGDCNAGLNILAQANALVNTAQAIINQLGDCITQAQAGGVTVDPSVINRKNTAQNQTNAARNELSNGGNGNVMNVWNRRTQCMTLKRLIKVHLMDESGDDMGQDVSIQVDNIVLEALVGGLFPPISGVSHCEGSTNFVDLSNVPVAGDASVPLPANAPPPPPGAVSTLPTSSVLSFTYGGTGGIQPTSVNNGTPDGLRIDVHLNDITSNTSC